MSKDSAEHARDWLDFKDPKKVAYGLGALAATIGVGVIAVKGGKKLFIAYGDRRTQAKGLISMGVLEQQGSAVSTAEREGALEAEGVGRDLFGMDSEHGFSYPLENPADAAGYLDTAKKLWNLIKDHIPTAGDDQQLLDEKQS